MVEGGPAESLEVTLFSFGFKYGSPEDANMVWDVRFLRNPYWEESLRHLTGKDKEIRDYVLESPSGKEFMELLTPLILFLVRAHLSAGKTSMRLGIGCTGGHHRSVAVVEQLGNVLQQEHLILKVEHRDIDKE